MSKSSQDVLLFLVHIMKHLNTECTIFTFVGVIELLIVSKSCSKMVKEFQVVKVLRGSTLWYLHFPLTCESYLPALVLCSCGDVPTPLGAESSGK